MAHSKKEPFTIRTHSLTAENDRTLRNLSQNASDVLGWTVGSSAVIRALLRYVKAQPPTWVSSALFPLIEEEIKSGTVWGSKKR
jgi:hypothetical protein